MFKEAIEDFDIVLRLDEAFIDATLLKGKCCYLCGDSDNAFVCYQQLITQNKNDPMMHIHAGNLLIANGCYEDAAKAFYNANDLQETAAGLYQEAKVNNN